GEDPISILLEGVEDYSTKGSNGRADSQIVVTLDPKEHEMHMVSIPRDTRVELGEDIAGKYAGNWKINAAYHFSSMVGKDPNLAQIRAVEQLLNVPIDKYVAVDFDGFKEIVDTLGGVDLDVKKGFWEKNYFF